MLSLSLENVNILQIIQGKLKMIFTRKRSHLRDFNKADYHEYFGDALDKWLFTHYFEWSYTHKSEVHEPVLFYTGYHYIRLNGALREGRVDVEDTLREKLLTCIASCPPIPENIITYRFLPQKTLDIIKDSKDGVFIENGFLSTTLDPSICNSDSDFRGMNCVLRIYVPKGSKAIYADFIENRGEKELLFPCQKSLYFIGRSKPSRRFRKYGIKIIYEALYNPFS